MSFENHSSTMQDSGGGGVSYNFMTNNYHKYVNCINSNYFTKSKKPYLFYQDYKSLVHNMRKNL